MPNQVKYKTLLDLTYFYPEKFINTLFTKHCYSTHKNRRIGYPFNVERKID